MQISSLVGSPVLSPSGERYGYVVEVRLTRGYRKPASFRCADDEEEEFYLPARTVTSYGDALLAGKARLTAPTGVPSPVGAAAYSHCGEALGVVSDLRTEEGGEEPALIVSDGNGTRNVPVSCASIGETVIVYPDRAAREAAGKGGGRAKTAGVAKKKQTPKPAEKWDMGSEIEERGKIPTASAEGKTAGTGHFLDRVNLLGRRVRRTVYDEAGAPVAVAGERITPAVLSAARRKNRLLRLTVNTLTNITT